MADSIMQRKLQVRLIEALKQLHPHVGDSERMDRILTAIERAKIPEGDYEGVVYIAFQILHHVPELFQAKTSASYLKQLMIDCALEYKKLPQNSPSAHHKNN